MERWTRRVIRHRKKIIVVWLALLAFGIYGNATIVRALLVPALMKILGDWNWFLPERMRRAFRISPAKPITEIRGGSE